MLLDSDAPQLFKKKLEKLSPKDPTMKMAFMEVLDRGKVPLPDRVAENVRCSTSSLDVSAGANSLRKISHRTRHVLVSAFLMLSLALVIFWPKDIFPKMAEPKLDAWLNAVQANFSAFLSMEVFAGEEHVPLRVLLLFATVLCAGAYSIVVLLSPPALYELELEWEDGKHSAQLTFVPQKPAVRHGEGGVVRSQDNADMFYYFVPSNKVSGSITLDGEKLTIATASGWYDHEFGGKPLKEKVKDEVKPEGETGDDRGWNWVSVQLDGLDVQLSSAILMDTKNDVELDKAALIIDEDGNATRYSAEEDGVELVGSELWRSTRSFMQFPTRWSLVVPGVCDLELRAEFPDQELLTMLVGAFWEGRLEVTGTYMGQPVTGVGLGEVKTAGDMNDLKGFFTSVGEKVRETVKDILPVASIDGEEGAGTFEQHRRLVANEKNHHLMNGLDTNAFEEVVLKPIRDVIDRGGKSWRAYGALACCDAVGGDSRKYVHLICLPELMHSGSLIIGPPHLVALGIRTNLHKS